MLNIITANRKRFNLLRGDEKPTLDSPVMALTATGSSLEYIKNRLGVQTKMVRMLWTGDDAQKIWDRLSEE